MAEVQMSLLLKAEQQITLLLCSIEVVITAAVFRGVSHQHSAI
jgi:hypothetical protein